MPSIEIPLDNDEFEELKRVVPLTSLSLTNFCRHALLSLMASVNALDKKRFNDKLDAMDRPERKRKKPTKPTAMDEMLARLDQEGREKRERREANKAAKLAAKQAEEAAKANGST